MTLPKRITSVFTNRPYWQLYVAGVLLLVLSGGLWWSRVYMNPERVFWDMVGNSLSTRGVTVEIKQSNEQSSIKQLMQMELGTTNRAHSLTTLTQGNTELKTEIIGTRDTDYTRYRSIDTDQTNAEGKPLDVDKVVGIWSKSDGQLQNETQAASNQLFAQTVLGLGLPVGSVPIPIGELKPVDRQEMLERIRDQKVYKFNIKDVKKERKNGRLQYTYDTKIQTILYVRMMKDFARNLGMHELDQVDPNTYQSAEALHVKLTVDALSRQLVDVENVSGGYAQSYKGYGLPVQVELPAKTISAAELHKRLSEL
jgi:hypothetical protein